MRPQPAAIAPSDRADPDNADPAGARAVAANPASAVRRQITAVIVSALAPTAEEWREMQGKSRAA